MGLPRLFPLLLAALLPAQRSCQSHQATSRGSIPAAGGGEYAVRLCGREFIRAVIFTCGGSRWKRISEQPATPPGPGSLLFATAHDDFLHPSSDKGVENIKLQLLLDPEWEQVQSLNQPDGPQSLKNLFNLHDENSEYVPVSNNLKEYIHQIEDAAQKSKSESWLASSMGSNNQPWVKYPRRKRDITMGIAGICCKWGCTKSEISLLC
uniref:Insulin-like domain-containing protein n=1 Tax=Salvator merianae TaxID=96440 RepID=A0A8D0C1G7_SALMN